MRPANTIGPYRIYRLISTGGQGSVYLGYDNRLQRKVAIKILSQPGARSGRKRLLQEARIIAGVDSPRVVQIYDVIVSGEYLALVFEYVPGCDLQQLLLASRLSLSSIITIATDICVALAQARQRRIVHGDIKAGNVLVTLQGRIKLTDFGIARTRGQNVGERSEAASISALAPEQLHGLDVDVRTDLFALGRLIYFMLSGVQPFPSDSGSDITSIFSSAPPELPPYLPNGTPVPAALLGLVEKLLAIDPQQRPANTHEVRRVLREVARQLPLGAGNTLLLESSACFRAESVADLPLNIPLDLQRQGRSRMSSGAAALIDYWRNPSGRLSASRLGFSAVILALGMVLSRYYLWPGVTYVQFDISRWQIASEVLPRTISRVWVIESFKQSVAAQIGEVVITGSGGGTPIRRIRSNSPQPSIPTPDEQLKIGLYCSAELCVLDLQRLWSGASHYEQMVLTPDMQEAQWREMIAKLTRRTYEADQWW